MDAQKETWSKSTLFYNLITMVIEKLKEWQDAKEQMEDEQILFTIDQSIQMYMKEKEPLEEELERIEMNLTDLFDQYFKIKWWYHPLDPNWE